MRIITILQKTQQPGTISRGEALHPRRPHLISGTIPKRPWDKGNQQAILSVIVAKANRMIGFLRRHCSTYVGTINQKRLLHLTFVRSHLGYASEVWAPQSCVSDLGLLEGIQRRATIAILGCNSDLNLRPSCKSRLLYLNLPISYWPECRDLFFFYKSLHGVYNFPLNNFISFATGNTRSATNLNLRPKSFLTSLFYIRDSFFNGTTY